MAAKGYLKTNGYRTVLIYRPCRGIFSTYGIVPVFHKSQFIVQLRRKMNCSKSSLCFLNSSHIAVHILHNRTIRIMIQGIHFCSTDSSVIQNRIPAFPDRSCSQIYAVHPSREAFLEKNVARHILKSILCQHLTKHCRAYKSAFNLITIFS